MCRFVCLLVAGSFLLSCSPEKESPLFVEQSPEKTGIFFTNTVTENADNNVLNYPYYFNGGGVAVGDINNDGLPDVYFSGNMVPNRLYLNKGDFVFEDITEKAGVAVVEGWKTGVTFADINLDGFLDIYVCRSAMGDSVLRENLLFVNNGDQTFTEKAREYGVNDNSYSTHASFFDYDKDGDADLFVLNHSLPQYAGFSNLLKSYKNQKGAKFQSKLYENDGGIFTDVSERSGIINNVLSFGLGLAISDINGDGWPDIYISNDFNEEDYLYINNQDKTFKNVVREAMGHVSLFSMGSDIADINNDALPDVFTLDMLPETNERIKLSSGDDNYDKYQMLINAGFHHQSMRNMLHLNNGDGTFSEIGQLMGISNTDWSWSALLVDFDGDRWKDVFVSNGYEKDYTNMQFLKFTVDEKLKSRQTGRAPDFRQILEQIPSIQVGNYLFKNEGNLRFTKKSAEWGISRTFKSNGAAAADLDNDGDPDLLINAMNETAVVYRNSTVENKTNRFLTVDLRRHNLRRILTGTKIFVHTGDTVQYHEFSPDRGFQSSMVVPVNIGLNKRTAADSVRIVWPDNSTQLVRNVEANIPLTPRYEDATGSFVRPARPKPLLEKDEALPWKHLPVVNNDFKRQFMLPRMYSSTGPRLVSADVNNDGLMDVYICGSQGQPGVLLIKRNGEFRETPTPSFERDKDFQDEHAVFTDIDNDKDADLYVVSGGYAFEGNDAMLQDRLYLNDGMGNFTLAAQHLPREAHAGGCVEAFDIDGDGDMDLFVGSRLVPGQYPISPQSMLLINDGKGKFTNEIQQRATALEEVGMVCDARAADVNDDGRPDLLVVGEWMPLKVFINEGGKLKDETQKWIPTPANGWWNRLVAADFDNDNDMDFVVGNYGLNNQFKVSAEHPATLVYKDFDLDGQVDPFFCYFIGNKSYPYASRDEALGEVSFLKTRFTDYTSYSNSTIETIFTAEELNNARSLKADLLETVYLENTGNGFVVHALPIQSQFSPVHAVAALDVDNDGDTDLIMGGNEGHVRVRIGKTDANKGFIFLNDGSGNFSYVPQWKAGLNLSGDVRDILVVPDGGIQQVFISEMGDSISCFFVSD